jgi:hypothetical protein
MSFRFSNLFPRVSAHSERDLFAWSLLAAIILLCLLALPFFSGGLYTADDLGNFHLPARAFYAQQLARGEPFDWMPGIYSGFYLTGDGQVGTYHPVHHLLYRFLPLQAAMGWEYLLSYPLMLSGMYFFLRRRLRRRDAAMVGSLAFTFSSFNLLHFVHPNAVAAVAHVPWLLSMIDIVLVDAKRWRVALAQAFLALLTGSQLLLGCPQFVWYSLLAESSFAAFLVITRKYVSRDGCETMPSCKSCIGCRRSSLWCVVAAKAIGLVVGAVQWLPTLDALSQSTLNGGRESPEGATLHPINLIQLIAPYMPIDRAFGGSAHELGLYVGAVPLMLALWVFARRRELDGMKRLAQAAAGFALAAIVLAVGSRLAPDGWTSGSGHSSPDGLAGTSYGLLWASWFHFSCRYTVLFQLAMAVLAAIGFVLVEREARENWRIQRHTGPNSAPLLPILRERGVPSYLVLWRRCEVLGATVLASLAVAVAGLILQVGHHVASPSRVLVGPLLMASAALLVIAAANGVRGALVGLVLFMAADLGYYGLSCTLEAPDSRPEALIAHTVAPPGDCPDSCRAPAQQGGENATVPLAEAAELNCPNRVFAPPAHGDGASAIGNQMTLAGWERTDGCAALKPRKELDYFQLAALRASSTRWVHRGPSTEDIAGLAAYDDDWSQVPDPLPPARFVTRVVHSDNPAADLARIDLRSTALCDRQIDLPPGTKGAAEITHRDAGQMDVKVNCSSPQLLVIAESYHSGWQCTIGGAKVPVYRVNGDFLGCIVQPGVEEVRFDFRPESLVRGRLATLIGLGLIGLCFFTAAPRRHLAFVEKIGLSRPAL